MKRRDFLTAMLGVGAVGLVPLRLGGLSHDVPFDLPVDDRTYAEVLAAAARLFEEQCATMAFPVRTWVTEASKIGYAAPDGIVFTNQFNVSWSERDSWTNDDNARWLEPAMASLATRCISKGIDTFGSLPVPVGCKYAGLCGPLRLVVAELIPYYPDQPVAVVARFDVLGGSSPAGQRRQVQERVEQTKRNIRQRVGTYRPASRLV